LVREQSEIAGNGAVSDKTQGFLVAGLREQALAHPKYDWVHHQP